MVKEAKGGGRRDPKSRSERKTAGQRRLERALLDAVRNTRWPAGRPRRCVHCSATKIIRWGRFSGRQRFRCGGCGRTFSDLTGTAFAYSKKLHLWIPFSPCMVAACPVRSSARRLGVDKDTTFRWRHRLIQEYEPLVPACAERGWVAVVMTLVPFCGKGVPRDGDSEEGGRRRGGSGRPRTLSSVVVHMRRAMEVLVFQWAHRSSWDFIVDLADPDERRFLRLKRHLPLAIKPGSVVAVEPFLERPMRRARRSSGDRVESVHPGGPNAEPRLQKLRDRAASVRVGWRRWMTRFRGVASWYLPEYLAWYRELTVGRESHMDRWLASARRQARKLAGAESREQPTSRRRHAGGELGTSSPAVPSVSGPARPNASVFRDGPMMLLRSLPGSRTHDRTRR